MSINTNQNWKYNKFKNLVYQKQIVLSMSFPVERNSLPLPHLLIQNISWSCLSTQNQNWQHNKFKNLVYQKQIILSMSFPVEHNSLPLPQFLILNISWSCLSTQIRICRYHKLKNSLTNRPLNCFPVVLLAEQPLWKGLERKWHWLPALQHLPWREHRRAHHGRTSAQAVGEWNDDDWFEVVHHARRLKLLYRGQAVGGGPHFPDRDCSGESLICGL